jgi:hypothetical protein
LAHVERDCAEIEVGNAELGSSAAALVYAAIAASFFFSFKLALPIVTYICPTAAGLAFFPARSIAR